MPAERIVTRTQIKNDLMTIGINEEMVLLLCADIGKVGWIPGGSQSLIIEIENILTENGTLMMPTFTEELSDPSLWKKRKIPKLWYEKVKREIPEYDENLSPSIQSGIITEVFRKQGGVLRSKHPLYSFCAWGKKKYEITNNHSLNFGLGPASPLGKLYLLKGYILLIGVEFYDNISLHLAEILTRNISSDKIKKQFPVKKHGERTWKQLEDIEYDNNSFDKLTREYLKDSKNNCKSGKIGDADSYLIDYKSLIDFSIKWFEKLKKFII